MAPTKDVSDSDMPQLFLAADTASLEGQSQYVRSTRARLALLTGAAVAGAFSWRVGEADVDALALVALVAFILALLLEGALWRSRPDKTWYDARAVAESVKTLAWKFAVCADPFPASLSQTEAVHKLLERLKIVQSDFKQLQLAPVDTLMVTPWMEDQRSRPWQERRRVYLNQRVRDQKGWYTRKAAYNKDRSNQWRLALVGVEITGVALALLEALNPNVPMLTPAIAATVSGMVAWVETKKHDFNARAYSAAVSDLAHAEAKLLNARDESNWAMEVNDTEDAISREHTLWLASRSQ